MIDPITFLTSTAVLIVSWYVLRVFFRFGFHSSVPAPTGWYPFGTYRLFSRNLRSLTLHSMLDEVPGRFGPLIHLSGLTRSLYIVSDASAIHQILSTPSFQRDSTLEYHTKGLFDFSLISRSKDPVYDRHKRILAPIFQEANPLSRVAAISLSKVDALVGKWSKTHQKSMFVVDIKQTCSALTLDVLAQLLMSTDTGAVSALDTNEATTLHLMINRMFAFLKKRMELFWWWYNGISSGAVFVMNTKTMLSSIMRRMIRQKKSKPTGAQQADVLDLIIESASRENETLGDDEIEGAILGLLLAGHRSTSSLLTYTIFAISQHPRIQAKLLEEVRSLGQNFTQSDLEKVQYLDWVLKETLRLHPPTPCVYRKSSEPSDILGHRIHANSHWLLSIRSVHRDSKYWLDPLEFKPERWNNVDVTPGAFLPFGEGAMSCLGQKLALSLTKAVLVKLLRTYSLKVCLEQDVKEITTFTTEYKDGVLVEFSPRIASF